VALIVLLASMGSFVPARACKLGPIDAIHTRIGAADDLANAQSTFMVEMSEAAAILHSASEVSLVLMDEIGRGTSTNDGLAIASAIATHLHDRCRSFTLFATHYFELTALAQRHAAAINVHVSAVEQGRNLVFLHALEAGPANRSFGVQVAKLAGLPASVVRQARATLDQLEHAEAAGQVQDSLFAELDLGARSKHEWSKSEPRQEPWAQALRAMNLDQLSPREALELLYRWQGQIQAQDPGH
jgi:DNA mismatch repair protein MutS